MTELLRDKILNSAKRAPPSVSRGYGEVSDFPKLQVVKASEVADEPTRWLWKNRIPWGLLTAIVGPEDVGKTYMYCALIGALTSGRRLPQNDEIYKADCLIYHGEDLKPTIRNRLEKCGADLSRVHLVSQEITRESLPDIREYLRANRAIRLVVLDPIAVILGHASENSDSEVRQALAPLSQLCEELDIVILYLRHTGKDHSKTVREKVLGAKAFVAVPRTVLALDEHKTTRRRAIFNVKNNLAEKAEPLEYFIDETGFHFGEIDESFDADDFARSGALTKPKQRIKSEDVIQWLKDALSEGPMPAPRLLQLALSYGISSTTLNRNKGSAGVESKKIGLNGGWFWYIPRPSESVKGEDYQLLLRSI